MYLSVLQHAQGVNNNPVTEVGCNYNRPYIVGHIVELSLLNVHSLDGTGLASDRYQNIISHCCARRGFVYFVFFASKNTGRFYPSSHNNNLEN